MVRALGDWQRTIILRDQIKEANPEAVVAQDVLVQGWPQGQLQLDRGVRVEKGCVLALGDEFNGYGRLAIGERTWVGQYNNFRLSGGTHIAIGKGCLISQFCSLVAANHRIDRQTPIQQNPCDQQKVNIDIGDDVWLGAGVAIMPAVVIGNGAVIGANSVVTKSIPEYEIWAGSPAGKIGERR
jgi:acetyltransferase-like isoleucine patch superfamily enzyme